MRYCLFAVVRHRIDGLEKISLATTALNLVRHRIDGLEMHTHGLKLLRIVRHRIDGLEIEVALIQVKQ